MLQKLTITILVFFIAFTAAAQPPIPGVIYADFTWQPGTIYPGTTVSFVASVNGASTPVAYAWDFGDGTRANTATVNVRHSYASQGTYNVYLKAYTGYGDSGTIIKAVSISMPVNNGATANFSYSAAPIYENTLIQFIDNSSTTSGIISGYLWSVDGGLTFSAGQNFSYTFSTYGQYEVTHKVNNSLGGQASVSKLITVLPSGTITQKVCAEGYQFLTCYNEAATYQWQVSTDSGISFQNIADTDPYYSFMHTNTLLLNYPPSSFYGNFYRCIAGSTAGTVYRIEMKNEFTGSVDNAWENPANWSCSLVPDANTDVFINSGTVIVSSNATCRTLKVNTGANVSVSTGFTLTLTH